MNAHIKKTLVAGLVALTAAVTLAAAPAQAHWHRGFGWGAAGLFTGLAIGTLAASPRYEYECGTVREAVVNRYGQVIGYRYVSAC